MTTTPFIRPAAAYRPPRAATGPIVVATTGGDGARALDAARDLAARTGTAVRVVSAIEPVPPVLPGIDGAVSWTPDAGTLVALQRDRVAEQLRGAGGDAAAWPVEIVVDNPPRAIADAARTHRASLVVVGIGRHDVVARLLGGEVALRTMRRAPVPVLAVTDDPFPVPARVAVAAIDFGASSVAAAHAALDLLGDGGTLHLVHVWSRHVLDLPAFRAAEEAYERALPARFAKVERALLDRARDVTILPASLLGSAVEQVVEFARSHGADLIAAGRRGHGLVERLLVGPVTTGLVRSAPCAVLVTPDPPVAERAALELALTGTTASHDRAEWPALLDAFTRRNAMRRTAVEVDDPELGAQAQETGYTFLGATYDRHDGRVELMLGDAGGHVRHLTRMIERATSIAVQADASGRDVVLSVSHGTGQTLLTFLPAPASGGARAT